VSVHPRSAVERAERRAGAPPEHAHAVTTRQGSGPAAKAPHSSCGPGSASQTGHDHADHAAAFRDRFWISLALALPVVVYSETVQGWLGYTAPAFPGSGLVAPLLGTAIFAYGGQPFLTGAAKELRERRAGG